MPADSLRVAGLTQEQFNAVIEKIETIYLPIATQMGGKLAIARKWDDGTVNANASRSGKTWKVNMYGGLARHATVTEDGFALVLCHELGHQLGGAPKVGNFMNKWAANEGQSDYFAALKCLRKAFLNDDNGSIVSALNAPETLVAGCTKNHANTDDKNICIRTGMAGVSVANLFAALRNSAPAKFETPDTSIVNSTNDAHPAYQCRLDTFFQGSLCGVGMNEDVSQKEEVQGTCHATLGHTIGLRPTCWFKAKVN
ncbi:MAG: hypothetical protein H0V66_12325 [Bdellovibrionales bacterium]|nr:hypothetical protein [Bdellovibrionales bacterium]